jgi:DNA-binding MarR family transcriptional regulator
MESLRKLAKGHVLGNPIRLGIMLYLLPRGRVLFRDLRVLLDITPGNLDSHLRTLHREGYVEIKKVIADRPRTMIKITEKGAKETKEYVRSMKAILSSF